MSEQPEALRLADDLDAFADFSGGGRMDKQAAAALLRRQHAEIERLRDELRQSIIDHARAEIEALRAECRVLVRQNGDWQEKFDALRAERDALRADAERYRWLRERPWFSFAVDQRYGDTGETLEGLDAAIDAARNKT